VNLISFLLGLLAERISLFITALFNPFSRMLAVQKFHHPKVLKEQEVTSLLQMYIRKIVFNHSMGMPFLLPHAREGPLLIEIASLGTAQVLWALLESLKV
jgi:hypothetical protein